MNAVKHSRAVVWLHRAVLGLALALMYAPVAMVFLYSFNESRIGSVWTGFSWRWYGELFQRRDLWDGLRTSLLVGLQTSTVSVVLGLLAAVGLCRWPKRLRTAAIGTLALPLVVPDIIIAVSLAIFFHSLGVRQGLGTVVLAHTTFGMAYAFVALSSAVNDLDRSLLDAALDSGATPWQAFWRITVPILWPSLIVAWLMVFAVSFDDFLITFLTKGPGTDTLPIKIYSRMRFGVRPDTNALFVLLFLFTMTGAIGVNRMSRWRGALR